MSDATADAASGVNLAGNGGRGVGAILRTAVDAVAYKPSTVGVAAVGGVLAAVPLVGSFLQLLANGVVADVVAGADTERHGGGSSMMVYFYLVVAAVLGAIAIGIGFVLLILPGIYFGLKFSLVVPAAIVGGNGPIDALGDSWSRTSGNLLTVLGVSLVLFTVALVFLVPVVLVIGLPMAGSQGGMLLFQVTAGVLLAPLSAVGTAAQVVMYRRFSRTAA